MNYDKIELIEIDLLLEAVFRRYGYDFRSYSKASIERRTRQFMSGVGCSSISEMIPKLLHDQEFFSRLVKYYSIAVTEMFRDPFVYLAIRKDVVPLLRSWPHVKVWHAGCATGEEVYSLATLLKEEGLYDRARSTQLTSMTKISDWPARGSMISLKLRKLPGTINMRAGKRHFRITTMPTTAPRPYQAH